MNLKDIKGVGDKINNILKEKGITDIPSLIYTLPSSYISYKLTGFSYTEPFNAKGTIIDPPHIMRLKNLEKVNFDVLINEIKFSCTAFNMPYLKNILALGDEVVICGEYSQTYKTINVSRVFKEAEYKEEIVPVYNIDGISNLHFKKIVLEALKNYDPRYLVIPKNYFDKYYYEYGKSLILAIHSPETMEEVEKAKEALKYYELLSFSLKMSIIRMKVQLLKKAPKNYDINKVKDFLSLGIHFDFTDDQKKATNDIFKYLSSETPLNMLLEGDVGSGKTIVALVSSYAVYTAGYQSLVMVPTEALAFQHYNTFVSYLAPFGLNIALLTSSTSTKLRKEILDNLKEGKIDIIIGTHSLLSDEVQFKNLGFIVCDEQHKFGVEQRKIIRSKGDNPDVLYMTATPIPRTLALTFFKDMSLETIRTLPKGRKKIYTNICLYKDYLKVLDFTKSEIEEGRQAYFVASIIDDNPDSSLTSVLRIKDDLDKYYKGFRIGLLHGKLSQEEKEDVINKFMNHEIDILASTSVIEVGIDNPNASVMVIIDANQFGLSSIHQLRGRVGRGKDDGYCFLMIEKSIYRDKLEILEETQDGFLISEEDLRQRGPGDFLGTDQTGIMKFRFANFIDDEAILNDAIKDAKELLDNKDVVSYYEAHLYSDNFD